MSGGNIPEYLHSVIPPEFVEKANEPAEPDGALQPQKNLRKSVSICGSNFGGWFIRKFTQILNS